MRPGAPGRISVQNVARDVSIRCRAGNKGVLRSRGRDPPSTFVPARQRSVPQIRPSVQGGTGFAYRRPAGQGGGRLRRVRKALLALIIALVAALAAAAAPAAGAQAAPRRPRLKAGVGKADITPQTGYYLGGWTRADRVAQGPAHAAVLARDGAGARRPQVRAGAGGPVHDPRRHGQADRGDPGQRGFSERNILISASHTHSGPGGYANFPTLNTAAPSLQTATDPLSFARFLSPDKADPLLYTFLTQADLDGHPARRRRPRHGHGRLGLVADPRA